MSYGYGGAVVSNLLVLFHVASKSERRERERVCHEMSMMQSNGSGGPTT